jgi:hypothetical protein
MNKNWQIRNYRNKRATGNEFTKKKFLGFLNGKRHYSVGRGSQFFTQRAPEGEVWDYE